MDHALPMGIVDRLGHGGHELRRLAGRQRSLGQPHGEALTVDVTHREIMLALLLADFKDRQDVRMVQQGRCLRLLMEAIVVGLRGEVAGQDHLHRHGAAQADLAGLVNHAHAAAGDLLEQFVVADAVDPRAHCR